MLKLALRSLSANPTRNVLTALSVMIAMALLTFVLATRMRAQEMLSLVTGRNNMLVIAKGDPMPLSFRDKIKAIPGVKRVLYMIVVKATSRDKKFQFVFHGTTADYMSISDSWFYVPPEDIARWETQKNGALVARQTAKDLNLHIGSQFTVDTELGPVDLIVSGISTKGYKNTGILAHHQYLGELFHLQGRANTFWCELDPKVGLKSVARTVDETFKNSSTPTMSISASSFLKSWAKVGKAIPSLLTAAGLIILLATLLVTATTIGIAVREKLPELATLRAIGFRRSWVLRFLMVEVLIVCLSGGLLGGALPLVFFRDGFQVGLAAKLVMGRTVLPPGLLGWVLLCSAGLAFASGLLPAWRASRVDVATALRAQA